MTNILLLILFLILYPLLLGSGILTLYSFIKYKILTKSILKSQKNDGPTAVFISLPKTSTLKSITDIFTTGVIGMLLVCGIVNVLAVLMELSVTNAVFAFEIAIVVTAAIAGAIIVILWRYTFVYRCKKSWFCGKKCSASSEITNANSNITLDTGSIRFYILVIFAIILGISQLLYLIFWNKLSFAGDQTLETVNSFLYTDEIYTVDPLTGLPYLNGYPKRLALQLMPFFYTSLCRIFGIAPLVLLKNVIPTYWLVCGYFAIIRLSFPLFDSNYNKKKKDTNRQNDISRLHDKNMRVLFFILYQVLLLCSDMTYGLTGFDIFHLGYSQVTVLELLVVIWTLGVALERDWPLTFLAIVVEPLLTSTRYGVGICFFITGAIILLTYLPQLRKLYSQVTSLHLLNECESNDNADTCIDNTNTPKNEKGGD